MKTDSTRLNFLDTCQKLGALQLEIGPSGNLSFRSEFDRLYITPTGTEFNQINQDCISSAVISDASTTGPKPSSDLEAHISIYKRFPEVKAIVHTHAHYVVLMAMLGVEIQVHNTMQADYFGNRIPCVSFSNHRQGGYGSFDNVSDGKAFLLEKHGGLLLFKHQDSEIIKKETQAFAEVAHLYYEYLITAKILSIEANPLTADDLVTIHDYYSNEYGDQKRVVQ